MAISDVSPSAPRKPTKPSMVSKRGSRQSIGMANELQNIKIELNSTAVDQKHRRSNQGLASLL